MIDLSARAKLTWYLEVTGRRADGLHDLRSEFATIDLEDRLAVDDHADYVRASGPFADSVPIDGTNLVTRALDLVHRRAGVTIEKRIPVGGGLGGGSADAAAILRWAGGVPTEDAARLGGDVPFCQVGGRALVEGAGERLTPLAFVARQVTLMMPNFAVNTAACYRAFDQLWSEGWRPSGRNHLEVPAGVAEPRLARTLAWLRAEFGPEVHLAGSGSSCFVEGLVADRADSWDVKGPAGPVRMYVATTTPQ